MFTSVILNAVKNLLPYKHKERRFFTTFRITDSND
ncbi:hypothetical protein SAMN05444350_1299 [Bacteroides stercorirosoris]|uniref:Uncharacterized protein n=1 Tax=Bacteroides stercorirosoris TaxID=871324 RepID=A0A1M6JFM5_9BACE|nr:hypothetical protein SAMN05444350_1299 [Bacteroides stercorirosoris]